MSSSATSSAGSTEIIDFTTYGEWNTISGPAIHAPAWVRAIILKPEFRIEFLDLSDPDDDFYAKNHIISAVIFVRSIRVYDTTYKSARIRDQYGYNAYFTNNFVLYPILVLAPSTFTASANFM